MKRITKLFGAALAGALAATTVVAPAASASTGNAPLINVLLADGDTFDRNPYDFDIVTEAAKAVLAEKPNSLVGVLADGNTPVTAFLPNDRAFQLLVGDLTGKYYGFFRFDEQAVFDAVAGLGIDTVETVLLYHVIPGATVDKAAALQSDGAVLTTAQGGTFEVDVLSKRWSLIKLKDADRNDRDPFVIKSQFDINAGNAQIAHGIDRVLRPLDL